MLRKTIYSRPILDSDKKKSNKLFQAGLEEANFHPVNYGEQNFLPMDDLW